ncbi:bifunctional indole-3-glycerol-phosphate synthase TrpC/phosphoribosylanthranilate isomerase TrpF [Sphingomonas piscis]|uniref:Multifunctional fusion protein n=1 Tax=Sphingomonas piscis TaxID=2714943 RepID=A0A6G7YNM9_9SPHN|nr:bifunctional indole-3-glycerol-phosphate synthase TrpC/phosphoribosylanthranilate isomerase TrpF [Sphingomonas piscis]QIK78348.1 bifunctional indole-3-glycerol-phosphate synthase TrpC/phosphoribosylanthranilate isomerase TrpF [Sphingomonas piscis]
MAEAIGILGEIVEKKKADLAERYAGVTLDSLRSQAEPTTQSLRAAMAMPRARFILEIKKASPSLGAIRTAADPAVIARGYAGVADGLSVLADGAYFGGSLGDVRAARAEFDGPILAKDFFIDLRQVPEARLAGADAILVMLSVLDDEEATAMIAEGRRLNMDALVEVHDEAEMRRALALDAQLIGINNRDLRDLSIDLATTEKLAALAGDRTIISESGVHSRSDVERLSPHVDGFLVGSSLMKADDPAEAARELVYGRVKLCGLRTPEDAKAARPARYAGLMFIPESPRYISLEEAEALAEAAPPSLLLVGVFRNAPVGEIQVIAERLKLHAVQLHGDEDRSYRDRLRRHLPEGTQIWQAVSAGRPAEEHADADRLLFDNAGGGTGEPFDWAVVEDHPAMIDALVAGGLGAHNARAAYALGCHAIDVGSSVDAQPGTKSHEKIAAVFDALRHPSRKEISCA